MNINSSPAEGAPGQSRRFTMQGAKFIALVLGTAGGTALVSNFLNEHPLGGEEAGSGPLEYFLSILGGSALGPVLGGVLLAIYFGSLLRIRRTRRSLGLSPKGGVGV